MREEPKIEREQTSTRLNPFFCSHFPVDSMLSPVDSKLPPRVLVVSNVSSNRRSKEVEWIRILGWCGSRRASARPFPVTKWCPSEDHRQSTRTRRWSTRVRNPCRSNSPPHCFPVAVRFIRTYAHSIASFTGVIPYPWSPGRYPEGTYSPS